MTRKESRLRGLEKFKAPPDSSKGLGDIATSAAGRLHGLEKFPQKGKEVEGLIPEGYDMPPEAEEQARRRTEHPGLEAVEDPEGIIKPGLLLISPRDPAHRRLVTHVYQTPRGQNIVVVHIEGSEALRNATLDSLHQKIREGDLVLPEASD